MKLRLLLLLIVSFSLGFALHAFLTERQVEPVNILSQNVLGQQSQGEFITYINYDGKNFNPSKVSIKKGNYIAITNKSKGTLMWLVSDNADLNTQRGYGEGEKLQVILLKDGEFKVVDKLNPGVSLSVKVE